jgi:hypothetical protein
MPLNTGIKPTAIFALVKLTSYFLCAFMHQQQHSTDLHSYKRSYNNIYSNFKVRENIADFFINLALTLQTALKRLKLK